MFNFLKRVPKWNKQTKHVPQPAFKLGGVQYWSYDSFLKHSPERAEWASAFYEQFSMRCTKEMLIIHCKAVDDALNSNPIKLTQIANWNKQLKDRLEYISDPETIYNLASVIFFTSNENLNVYDETFNKKKIALWKKHTLKDFFLQVPWTVLLPAMDFSSVDLERFIAANNAAREINQQLLEDILQHLSKSELTEDLRKDVQSQLHSLKGLATLNA